jgi:hypothetical protein
MLFAPLVQIDPNLPKKTFATIRGRPLRFITWYCYYAQPAVRLCQSELRIEGTPTSLLQRPRPVERYSGGKDWGKVNLRPKVSRGPSQVKPKPF